MPEERPFRQSRPRRDLRDGRGVEPALVVQLKRRLLQAAARVRFPATHNPRIPPCQLLSLMMPGFPGLGFWPVIAGGIRYRRNMADRQFESPSPGRGARPDRVARAVVRDGRAVHEAVETMLAAPEQARLAARRAYEAVRDEIVSAELATMPVD